MPRKHILPHWLQFLLLAEANSESYECPASGGSVFPRLLCVGHAASRYQTNSDNSVTVRVRLRVRP